MQVCQICEKNIRESLFDSDEKGVIKCEVSLRTLDTFSLDGNVDEAGALVDVVGLLIKLQSWFVLSVINVYYGTCCPAQQCIHRHTQLYMEALSSLKHLVIIDDNGAHLGVLTFIKLYL